MSVVAVVAFGRVDVISEFFIKMDMECFGAYAVVVITDASTHLIEQFWRRGGFGSR